NLSQPGSPRAIPYQLFIAPASIQAAIRSTSAAVSGTAVAGSGIGEPHGAGVPTSLLWTLLNRRLVAELLGATRTSGGIAEVPVPMPAALTPTRLAYAAVWVLMSSMPTLTPLPPGRWQPMQRWPMIVA